jgi:hypothetical protein
MRMMKKYLINDICEFEILTQWDSSYKYNILSTCFFKMGSHYKNFDTYVRGLKKLIRLVESQSKYVLRIFIDTHIKADEQIYPILLNSNVQIILFKCFNYMDKSNYHIDVFGALVRLFPIFDFDANDSLNVIIVDVDLNQEDLTKLKILMDYNTSDKEIIGMGMIDKLLITRYRPHFFCGLFGVFNVKFPKSIIVNFINDAENINDKGIYGKRLKPFGYGTDELFLNEYFLYLDNYKYIQNIKLGMLLNYDINWFMYHYKNELLEDLASKTYINLKIILGKFYKPNMTSEQMFELIDKLTYQIKSNNTDKIYISNNFYKLISELNFKNLEWFSLEHIKLIYKYFYNIVDCLSVIYFNPQNLDISGVNILEKNIIKF